MAAQGARLSLTRILVWSGLICVVGGAAIVMGSLITTDFDDPEQAGNFLTHTRVLEELEPESNCHAVSSCHAESGCPGTQCPSSAESVTPAVLASTAEAIPAPCAVKSSCGKEHACPLSKLGSTLAVETTTKGLPEKSAQEIVRELTQGGPVSEELKPLVDSEIVLGSVSEIPHTTQPITKSLEKICDREATALTQGEFGNQQTALVHASAKKSDCCDLNLTAVVRESRAFIEPTVQFLIKKLETKPISSKHAESSSVQGSLTKAPQEESYTQLHRHWTSIIEKGYAPKEEISGVNANSSSISAAVMEKIVQEEKALISSFPSDEELLQDYFQCLKDDSAARKEFLDKMNESILSGKYEGILLTPQGTELSKDLEAPVIKDQVDSIREAPPVIRLGGAIFHRFDTLPDSPVLRFQWVHPGDHFSQLDKRPIVNPLSQVLYAEQSSDEVESIPSHSVKPAPIGPVAESIPGGCPKAMHLRRAADELDKAGMADKAAELRKQADDVQAAFEAEELRNQPVQVTGGQVQELQKTLAELREEVKQLKATIEGLKGQFGIGLNEPTPRTPLRRIHPVPLDRAFPSKKDEFINELEGEELPFPPDSPSLEEFFSQEGDPLTAPAK